jgi:putative endonuclease
MSVGPFTRLRLTILERSLFAARSVGRRFPRAVQRASHLELGERGELAAYFHLRSLGATIVARQWRSARLRGDLDLVAWQGDTLCFVEVKTRSARDAFRAEVAVDKNKREMLRRMARAYLRQMDGAPQIPVRFDIVTVYIVGANQEFEVFPGAFGWAETSYDALY